MGVEGTASPTPEPANRGTWRGLLPLVGALLGLVAFASGLGLAVANPTRYQWLLNGDWAVHFMGWHLYRGGPWTVPIGATPNLGWPIGTSVGLTDSIPVFAVAFKLLTPVLPSIFQYFGIWLLLCYVLQGVFGVLLMRLCTPRAALQVLGAGLLVMSPPFIARFGHPALSAHWLLLASLWLYLKYDPRSSPALSPLLWWALIIGTAAATHPYIALMTLILMTAAHARWLVVRPSTMWPIVGRLVSLVAVAGLTLWQSGYFLVSEENLRVGGFGMYSMNLLAPLMPAGASRLFGSGAFSYFSPGQYEGYAYLGAGMLLLAAVWLAGLPASLWRMRWQRRHWQHVPLGLACLLFLILALSPVVTAGSRTLFEYDGKWLGPLATFRASGRMFWPVFYVLMVAILFAVAHLRFAVSLTLLTAAFALQAFDLSDSYRGLRDVRSRTFTDTLQSRFWRVVPPYYRHLMLMPTNICSPDAHVEFMPFVLLAGRLQQTINAGLAARYDMREITSYCLALREDFNSGNVHRDTLYALQPALALRFRAAAQTRTVCTAVDGYHVCTSADDYLAWQEAWDIVLLSLPPVDDFLRFYDALEDDYRNRLKRAPHVVHNTTDDRVTTIVRYLGYRLDECSHDEATTKTIRQVLGERVLRICKNVVERKQALPPANETFEFLQRLESLNASRSPSRLVSSYIDLEGEAVWLQEYLRQRLSGRDHTESTEVVLRAVRQVAPTPQ